MKTGDKASVDPILTGLTYWVEGIVIKIRNNPFIGKEVVVKDNNTGAIYFDAAKYFKLISK
jgi:DNA/RNA endonuclease YhcR with UshA esterase domain